MTHARHLALAVGLGCTLFSLSGVVSAVVAQERAGSGVADDTATSSSGSGAPAGGRERARTHEALRREGPSPLRGFLPDPAWAPLPLVRPDSHDTTWLEAHGAEVGVGSAGDCVSCHTEESCASCHAAENVSAAVHPAGFVLLHGTATDTADCASCHTPTRFCASCHQNAELTSAIDDRPPAWEAVHPANWLEPGGHSSAARLDLLSCASCHSDDTCVQCHATTNPHGSAFMERCSDALRAAEPTCATCHTSRSTLPLDALRTLPECAR